MDLYKIVWKISSEHDLRNIEKKYIHKILDKIEALATDPFPYQSKKLKGSEMGYRIHIGKYRALYQVDTIEKIITVSHIRHRKDIYRNIAITKNNIRNP